MATDWFEAIDNYCERTDASLWAEPLNAFSNLAFIVAFVAGLWCYRRYRQETGRQRWEFILLLALLCAMVVMGTWAGSQILHRVNERAFTILYKTVLTVIAVRLVVAEVLELL